MPLAPANQAQLIRSSQKDEYYRSVLRNNANEAFHTLAGSKRWLDWRREIELLSDLAYYSLTTFSGYQTLGEEYVNIIQVDPTKRQIPSRARRGLFILCHAYFPYLLEKVLVCLENELEGEQESRGGVSRRQAATGCWSLECWLRRWVQRGVALLTEPQRRACLPAVLVVQQGVTLLHRLHVALFYISSSFYHLSKRAAGIGYLRVMGLGGDDATIRTSYRLLGVVSLLQLLVTVSLQLNNFRQRQRARQEWKLYRKLSPQHNLSSNHKAARCILCLEARRHSTSTPCGHLFCWECITEWCNTKPECPLCREKFLPHRLVYLRNYS
ncbi:peroxisome biogenesis factor 10 [Melanotaenia boesemani]|uniref:peroxisome biogenesis factor 10 n=1 Tax=Melanotaenia boesemani TaxID=1250792 RepID=UPI001C03BB66|nr:peroxisome biogenesis factor 10 [Melanotaenia boesemani]XP_041859002.1 peroxisome biogenesis factor 10 [Melanotaenia boesemani]XP_041859003.1 peroxisome biogenesis factor 10 [Melanotaenia boesemani]